MDTRLDGSFESWGQFARKLGEPGLAGRLHYSPSEGLRVELVGNPLESHAKLLENASVPVLLGQLVDGTQVTLVDLMTFRTSMGAGGVGLPTVFLADRAIFGGCFDDANAILLKTYTVEISSLSNWMSPRPVTLQMASNDKVPSGVDLKFRRPTPIEISIPDKRFDLKLSHGWKSSEDSGSASVRWYAGVSIMAKERFDMDEAREIASQFQNLLSLLVGRELCIRSITMKQTEADGTQPPLQLVYRQSGRHDLPDLLQAQMMLPYEPIRDEFADIVRRWFSRTERAILATNVFFGSARPDSSATNVRFLSAMQSAESYHRSFGTGTYMNQANYDDLLGKLSSAIPTEIHGDHRVSLINRLKYGNEYSLRKRLNELFGRIPKKLQDQIAGDVPKFVAKAVNTRNYFTHYDSHSKDNSFEGIDVPIAAHRIRLLVIANILHDLGITDDKLVAVIGCRPEFRKWLAENLPL